jgi:acetyl esterase/lipase
VKRDAAAFHPDLQGVSRWLPRGGIGRWTVGPARRLAGMAGNGVGSDITEARAGAVSVRIHRPRQRGDKSAALLWIHGGGYVIGTAAQDDAVCRLFSDRLGIVVAAVDYRLAPDWQFPVPLDDCYEALSWLAEMREVDSSRIAVGGASAGGGLAAALALLARDRGEMQLAFQLLAYPMLDDRTAARHDIDETNFRLWNNKANRFGWQSYTGLAPGSRAVSGLAAPARTEDLSGLPPAWIGVGTWDLFHDEDIAYARRLTEAGVECVLCQVEGAFHGFDLVKPSAGVSREFRSAQATALAAALH